MHRKILFQERQKFNQWWVVTLLVAINALFLVVVYMEITGNQPFGEGAGGRTAVLLSGAMVVLPSLLFLLLRLDTLIKDDGIYVRFFPFHFSYRFYDWAQINKLYVRQYAAVTEFGGWGIRFSIFGKGRAYNVSGNQGLQIEFRNNKKLLIGTTRPAEVEKALMDMGRYQS